MKNAILYSMGLLLIGVAAVAGYYSFAQSTSYIDVNLGASKTWYIIAAMAIIVELLGLYMITQMFRVGQVMAIITIPAIVILNITAIGVSIYLEGGKATQVLSDARASRSVDATLSAGHNDSLKQLLATQKKYIDSRRVDQARVAELNKKIQEQAKWARKTAVSEINPMISMTSEATGFTEKTIAGAFIILMVAFPLLVKMLFGHIGLMLLTTPYREAKQEPIPVPAPSPKPVVQVTPEPTPKVTPEDYEETEVTPSRLGVGFVYKDNVIRLEKFPKSQKEKKKKQNAYKENQRIVEEFLEGCDLVEFTSTQGWDLFSQQYPDTLNRPQFNSAINALAKRKEGFRKKTVKGQKKFELLAA